MTRRRESPAAARAVDNPRRRLEQLRSIPEAARTNAEWDELNELEISFAPGNSTRHVDRDARSPRRGSPRTDNGGAQAYAREGRFGRPGKPNRP